MKRNIEVKARCPSLAAARRAARMIGARRAGVLHQLDTYFHVPRGRLKLREIRGQRSELIWYDRPALAAARDSHYTIVNIAEPKSLKSTLSVALGIRSTVSKQRELWLYRNVRIHLDRVQGLGTFIELEAVISRRHAPAVSRRRLAWLIKALAIRKTDQLAASYGELIDRA